MNRAGRHLSQMMKADHLVAGATWGAPQIWDPESL